MCKMIRRIEENLRALGIEVLNFRETKHYFYKIKVNGKVGCITISRTKRDSNIHIRNVEGDFKRFLKLNGEIERAKLFKL